MLSFTEISNKIPTSLSQTAWEEIFSIVCGVFQLTFEEKIGLLQGLRDSTVLSPELLRASLMLMGFNPPCLSRIKEEKLANILDYLPLFQNKKGSGCVVISEAYKFTTWYLDYLENNNITPEEFPHKEIIGRSILGKNSILYP